MTKAQIRFNMKRERNLLSKDDQMEFSKAIQEKLYNLEVYRKCSILLTYVSFQSEVHTRAIIYQALENKKKVFAPRVEDKNMDFYEINNTNTLIQSKFGILEPKEEEKTRYQGTEEIKLMLLPCLAFDNFGNRIGYGAGFYDNYLRNHSQDNFIKIALAYDFQILELINAEDYDVKTDMIITPSKIIHCR